MFKEKDVTITHSVELSRSNEPKTVMETRITVSSDATWMARMDIYLKQLMMEGYSISGAQIEDWAINTDVLTR